MLIITAVCILISLSLSPSSAHNEGCMLCYAKNEGLVRYPTRVAPDSESINIRTQCADNAHIIAGSNLDVTCTFTGIWSGTTPQCDCNDGYREATVNHAQLCEAIPSCPAQTVGLVHYPATLAPKSRSQSVATQCADNAHSISRSVRVRCSTDGSWSGETPQCECDEGYRAKIYEDRQFCEALPSCPAMSVGLVRYPTTVAPLTGSRLVSARCADNAHKNFSLNIRCNSDGAWSGATPRCQCNDGYRNANGICEAIPASVCRSKNEGLVRFPTTLAQFSRAVEAATQCADNAHKTSASLTATCMPGGVWSGVTPQCECNEGYREYSTGGRRTCKAIPSCPAKAVGLVHYPTKQAPERRSVTVTTQCADNAHIRAGSSLNVQCTSSGSWSGTIPQCDCNTGYRSATENGREFCEAIPSCPGKVVDLVRYQTTSAPAPVIGSVTVTMQCADNAHIRTGSSLDIMCNSDGIWSGTTPQCDCDTGYRVVTVERGRQQCEAVPKCPGISVGLVRYPATPAPASGSVTITTQCADNAHMASSSLEVACTSSGVWSNMESVQCDCDDGYYLKTTVKDRLFCRATVCETKIVGLVHYPTTFGNHPADVRCVDHAVRTGPDVLVWCNSDGSWSPEQNPECQCSQGYRSISRNGRKICEAIPRCPAKSVGLVRYFTTYACTVAELPCADNAHSNSSNMSAWCDFSGAWSDQTPPPHCLCDEGYRVVTINDEEICEAIPSCPAKIEGLVHYPTTLAPVSGSKTVTTQCADNANWTRFSPNVTCAYDGSWSGQIPQCECDLEYNRAFNGRQICLANTPSLCKAKSEGLVRYPNWIAPVTGFDVVATQCADNAHLASPSLNVTCTSDGNWSAGLVPHCDCDDGHHMSTSEDGTDVCQGDDNPIFSMLSLLTVSGSGLLFFLTLLLTIILALCLIRATLRGRKQSKSKTEYNKLWVHMDEPSNSFADTGFGRRKAHDAADVEYRDDDEDEEDCSPSQPANSDGIRQHTRPFESVGNIVFPSLTFARINTEPRESEACVLNQASIEIEQPLENTIGQVPRGGETGSEDEEESNDGVISHQTSHNIFSQNQADLDNIEEIYVEVANHSLRRKKRAEEETNSEEETESEEEEGTATSATGEDSATAAPQGGEYDDIVTNRRLKKPRNIDDVEEIYDVVVNQLATRKDSTAGRIKAYAVYTVPAPSVVPISLNEAYTPNESVPLSTNEAYASTEGAEAKDHYYAPSVVPISLNEAYTPNESVPLSTNEAYASTEGAEAKDHYYAPSVVPISLNEAYTPNESVPLSTNEAYTSTEGAKAKDHYYDLVT